MTPPGTHWIHLWASTAALTLLTGAATAQSGTPVDLGSLVLNAEAATDNGDFVAKRSATGLKTNAPIEDVPQSVSALPRERLDAQNIASINDGLCRKATAGTEGDVGYQHMIVEVQWLELKAWRVGIGGDNLHSGARTAVPLQAYPTVEGDVLIINAGHHHNDAAIGNGINRGLDASKDLPA